jgi:hypothetical protein
MEQRKWPEADPKTATQKEKDKQLIELANFLFDQYMKHKRLA